MPIQIQEITEGNEPMECPLCMESLEVDDINFFPCACGYQVCRFCWHRIRTDENGLCPACRTSYPENPAEFRPLTESDLQKIRQEKRQKEVQRRQKLTDGRRHLAAIRVLQKNLVFVVGLSQRLSDPEILKRQEYFGKYGKIIKVVINSNTAYAGAQGPSCSAYVTYSKMEEALRAIQSVNNVHIDGRTLKASLGTTKYCSTYLKNQQCHKADCMYLHELAEEEASFTKEDMQVGKHQELEQRLIDLMIQKEVEASQAPAQPSDTSTCTESESITQQQTVPPVVTNEHRTVENSWVSGMQHVGEQGLSARLSSSLEDTEIMQKPHAKSKKLSPLHTAKHIWNDNNENEAISSENSSATTSPPPDIVASGLVDSCVEDFPDEQADSTPVNIPTNKPDTSPTTIINLSQPEPSEIELSQATEALFISNPAEQPKTYKPFQSFNQPTEEYRSLNAGFPLDSLLQPRIETTTWNHDASAQELPDAIPIKSSNDWEAAFGFSNNHIPDVVKSSHNNNNAEPGDDDLGFDPWLECTKGLADLLEKEKTNTNHSTRAWPMQQVTSLNPSLPNAFSSRQAPINNHFGTKPNNFSSGYPLNSSMGIPFHQNSNHHQRADNFNPHFNKRNLIQSPTHNGLSDWQNGLRALLPSVNINFAMDNNQSSSTTTFSNPAMQNTNIPGFGRTHPPLNPSSGSRPMFSMGYDDWGTGTQAHQSQSSFFMNTGPSNRSQPPIFRNGFAHTNSTDRYSPIAPPPGLGSSMYPSDPAIISSGNKPPAHITMQQHSVVEETPHWMKSLQTLTDSDSSMNPTPTVGLLPQSEPTQSSFTAWPSFSNAGMRALGTAGQPPPGFQGRLPHTNNNATDFAIRHSLLENQS